MKNPRYSPGGNVIGTGATRVPASDQYHACCQSGTPCTAGPGWAWLGPSCRAGRSGALIAAAALAVGFAVRLWGLSRPPLEFHPARQFMGASFARHYYLAGRQGVPLWRRVVAERNMRNENMLEPHILEHMAVAGYRVLGHEALWIPRGFSVCFWLLGGVFLLRIALRLCSPMGVLVALSVHLFMPFGILASRSFQPDPLMICLELAALLALVRFAEGQSLARLLVASVLCVFAVFVKPVCLPVLVGVYGVGLLRRQGWAPSLTSRYTWVLAGSLAAPAAYYAWKILLDSAGSDLGGQAAGSVLPALLLTGGFWRGLAAMLGRVIGYVPLLLALAGLLLVSERPPYRGTLAGMWLGYVLFVLTFTYHTHTHDYYHLQLVPIAALSIGALASGIPALWATGGGRRRFLGLVLVLAVMGVSAGGAMEAGGLLHGTRSQRLKAAAKAVGAAFGVPQKFMAFVRPESIGTSAQVAAARAAGEAVKHSAHTVFLGEDGGTALVYLGEFSGVRWPSRGQIWAWELQGRAPVSADLRLHEMLEREPSLEYFVVTDFGDLAQQPDLEQLLAGYPPVARGPGYAVYSLRR